MIYEISSRTFVDDEDGRTVVEKVQKDLEGKINNTIFIGIGPLHINGKVYPIEFVIEAESLDKAFEAYPDTHKAAVQKQMDQLTQPKLIVPPSAAQGGDKKIVTGNFSK